MCIWIYTCAVLSPSVMSALCDPMDCSPLGSSVHGDSPGKNTEVGSLSLLQGIFPIQELNWGLLHCRWILYQLSFQGSMYVCVYIYIYTTTTIYVCVCVYIYIYTYTHMHNNNNICVCMCIHTHILLLLFSCWVVSDSLWPHELQNDRLPSFTLSRSLLKLMSIQLVMPSSRLIHCHPILLLPSTFPSIRVFSNESALHIRWPNYWSFSFSTSLSNEYLGLISFRIYTYKYIYMYLLFMFFSMILQDIEYSALWNAVNCAVYLFYINVYLLTLIYTSCFPFGNHNFVFYVCESVSLL